MQGFENGSYGGLVEVMLMVVVGCSCKLQYPLKVTKWSEVYRAMGFDE